MRAEPFAALLALALAACSVDEIPEAPVAFDKGRVYEGLGVYKNVELAEGDEYFAYGEPLPVKLGGIDLPARCLLADFSMGGYDVVADFGSDSVSGDGDRSQGAVGWRASDSAFFFMYEFRISGTLDQSCAILEQPFDTSFVQELNVGFPVRKLVVLGWNDLASVTSGGVTTWYPRTAGPKDSVYLRYGAPAVDTLEFAVDSLRRLTGPADARLVRVPASSVVHSGILRHREQVCLGAVSSCVAEKDTLYRDLPGARDTVYKLVTDGEYILVESPRDDERVWGRAWRVLRGKDTALVMERTEADSVVLATLYYVLRGGDTLLSADTLAGAFALDTIVSTVRPDTVEIVERTVCADGRARCSADSLSERTVSTGTDTSSVSVSTWQSALVAKVDPCARLNRFSVVSFSNPSSGEKRFVRNTKPRFALDLFALDPAREDCSSGGSSYLGWALSNNRRVLDPDTLAEWWNAAK